MKTIQIIDGAENCAYDCFLADDELFEAIFPEVGQDIEFIEDFLERVSDGSCDGLFALMWERRVPKKSIKGIDGSLELLSNLVFEGFRSCGDLA